MADDIQPTVETPVDVEAVEPASPVTPENNVPPVEPGTKAPVAQPERTVPYSALREERSRRQELAREIASLRARESMVPQGDGELTAEQVMAHPYVQQLILDRAERELKDFARDELDKRPHIPANVVKQILRNPRGFVSPQTTDIENAKLDLLDYLDGWEAGDIVPPPGKAFPVAATNAPVSKTAGTPAELQRILNKPPEDLTDEEAKIVEDALKNTPRK